MRIEIEKTVDGEEVEILVPENAADERTLARKLSFGTASLKEGMTPTDPKGDFLDLGD